MRPSRGFIHGSRILSLLMLVVITACTLSASPAEAVTVPSTSGLLSPSPGSNGETYDQCIDRATAIASAASTFYYQNADGLGPVWRWYTQDFTPAYLDFIRACNGLPQGSDGTGRTDETDGTDGTGGGTGGSDGGDGTGSGTGTNPPPTPINCGVSASPSVTSLDPHQPVEVKIAKPDGVTLDTVAIQWGDNHITAGDVASASYTYTPAPHTTLSFPIRVSVTGSVTSAGGSPTPCEATVVAGTVQVLPFAWNELLYRAEAAYSVAKTRNATSSGYYMQVLNLVCAAAQSHRPSCQAMVPAYGSAPKDWAGEWIYDVFTSFLDTKNLAQLQAELDRLQSLVDGAENLANSVCGSRSSSSTFVASLCRARSQFATTGDEAALMAGLFHFAGNLRPGFQAATNAAVAGLPDNSSMSQVRETVTNLRAEHQNLLTYAVKPGFDVVAGSGQISPLGARVAKALVPAFAESFRETAIRQALIAKFGPRGARLYRQTLPRR